MATMYFHIAQIGLIFEISFLYLGGFKMQVGTHENYSKGARWVKLDDIIKIGFL